MKYYCSNHIERDKLNAAAEETLFEWGLWA